MLDFILCTEYNSINNFNAHHNNTGIIREHGTIFFLSNKTFFFE